MDFKQYEKLINDKLRKYTLAYAKKTELSILFQMGWDSMNSEVEGDQEITH